MIPRPLRRRLFAAIVLLVFATGSVFFWNNGGFDLIEFGVNLIAACVGLAVLHFRWKRQEARALTPRKVKDIFS